jgi:hypothetical protein
MIFTSPALCSENSVKFSTKSSSRGPSGLAMSHVPRIITSSDTRRGSSSRSMRLGPCGSTSKNRSQSAVSETTGGSPKCEVRIPKFSQFDNRQSSFVISPAPGFFNSITTRLEARMQAEG